MSEQSTLAGHLDDRLPNGARFRPLGPDDAAAVARIQTRLGQPDQDEYWSARLERFLSEGAVCLGVEAEGRLVAYMVGQVRGGGEFGLAGGTGWVELLGVEPAWQGRGLARLLAEALFQHFIDRGVERVLTMASARDDGLRLFFRSLGFRPSQLQCLERRL